MKKILLSALVIFIIFFAISESCKTRLSKKNLSWNPYEKGDEIILKSNLGSIDSIKILNVAKNWYEGSISNGRSFESRESLKVLTNTGGEGFNLIQISRDNIELWVMNYNDERYFGGSYFFENENLLNPEIMKTERDTSLIVLDYNQKIKNCYKLADYSTIELIKQNPKIDYQNFIKYVYWNKEIGLLGYERYSGEIFKLSNYKK